MIISYWKLMDTACWLEKNTIIDIWSQIHSDVHDSFLKNSSTTDNCHKFPARYQDRRYSDDCINQNFRKFQSLRDIKTGDIQMIAWIKTSENFSRCSLYLISHKEKEKLRSWMNSYIFLEMIYFIMTHIVFYDKANVEDINIFSSNSSPYQNSY